MLIRMPCRQIVLAFPNHKIPVAEMFLMWLRLEAYHFRLGLIPSASKASGPLAMFGFNHSSQESLVQEATWLNAAFRILADRNNNPAMWTWLQSMVERHPEHASKLDMAESYAQSLVSCVLVSGPRYDYVTAGTTIGRIPLATWTTD